MSDENGRDQKTAAARPRLGRSLARLLGETPPADAPSPRAAEAEADGEQAVLQQGQPGEHGGPKGPEPTRYGDWERKGRCIDF